jgi:hypothetical protein
MWNEAKATGNVRKHGISFDEAASSFVENGDCMKKANKIAPAVDSSEPAIDDDEMLPEFDFSKAEPAPYWKKMEEGATVIINGKPFVVREGGFVPRHERSK